MSTLSMSYLASLDLCQPQEGSHNTALPSTCPAGGAPLSSPISPAYGGQWLCASKRLLKACSHATVRGDAGLQRACLCGRRCRSCGHQQCPGPARSGPARSARHSAARRPRTPRAPGLATVWTGRGRPRPGSPVLLACPQAAGTSEGCGSTASLRVVHRSSVLLIRLEAPMLDRKAMLARLLTTIRVQRAPHNTPQTHGEPRGRTLLRRLLFNQLCRLHTELL